MPPKKIKGIFFLRDRTKKLKKINKRFWKIDQLAYSCSQYKNRL